MSDLSARLDATGRLLVRSSREMHDALESMQRDAAALTAELGPEGTLFLSRLLQVDGPGDTLVVACSDVKHANSALLGAERVAFSCNHAGVHYQFAAANPRETTHAAKPAIALSFPNAMLVVQRRSQERFAVPPAVPLHCEVALGALSFVAKVVDISPGGLGAIVYDAGILLVPGMHLPRTHIRHPERSPVLADLEVRHVTPITAPDGTRAWRAGCRIIAGTKDLEDLVRLFVTQG